VRSKKRKNEANATLLFIEKWKKYDSLLNPYGWTEQSEKDLVSLSKELKMTSKDISLMDILQDFLNLCFILSIAADECRHNRV
jgi:hypothetical protein